MKTPNASRATRRIARPPSPSTIAGLCLLLSCASAPGFGAEAADGQPVPVSPGGADRILVAPLACPSFSWGSAAGATAYELVVTRLDEPEVAVLSAEIPGTALSWTPPGDRCLEPGRYLWSVRAAGERPGEWAAGRAFEVPANPTAAEIARARQVLERFLEASGAPPAATGAPDAAPGRAESSDRAKQARTSPDTLTGPLGSAPVALLGSYSGAGGIGVAGFAVTADSAGLAGDNAAGGADLMLGGPVAAAVTQSSWTLDAAAAQVFDFSNPSGALTLRVNGSPVLTGALPGHDHYGESWTGSAFSGLSVTTTTSTGNSAALRGAAPSATGFVYGVWGETSSTGGRGVAGWSYATSGQAFGVHGRNTSPDGAAIFGWTTATTGNAFGVQGHTSSTSGTGVQGVSLAGTGTSRGVWGHSWSAQGAGGLFSNNAGGLLIAADNVSNPDFGNLEFSVDTTGNVVAESYAGDGSKLTGIAPSLFGVFGGNGSDGALAIGSNTSLGGTANDGVPEIIRKQYTTLTIAAGVTLSSNAEWTFIAVQGRCTINGTLSVDGAGAASVAWGVPGLPGYNGRLDGYGAVGGPWPDSDVPVDGCVSGAGGSGGATTISGFGGGHGGGAEGWGGDDSAGEALPLRRWRVAHVAAGYPGDPLGRTVTDGFDDLLACVGGAGGSGTGDANNPGANSGRGGGVLYLECGEIDLPATGVLSARGNPGANGACSVNCGTTGGSGGGGGGGGGVALARTLKIVAQAGLVRAQGGSGGNGSGQATAGGAGAPGYADLVEVR